MKKTVLKTILFGIAHVLRLTAARHSAFREWMQLHDCIVQIKLKDDSIGSVATTSSRAARSSPGPAFTRNPM